MICLICKLLSTLLNSITSLASFILIHYMIHYYLYLKNKIMLTFKLESFDYCSWLWIWKWYGGRFNPLENFWFRNFFIPTSQSQTSHVCLHLITISQLPGLSVWFPSHHLLLRALANGTETHNFIVKPTCVCPVNNSVSEKSQSSWVFSCYCHKVPTSHLKSYR